MTEPRPKTVRVVFFCNRGQVDAKNVHRDAKRVLSESPDLGRIEVYHAGIDQDRKGQYELEGRRGTHYAGLHEIEFVVPVNRDVQSILRGRIHVMDGQKPTLISMNEHGIDSARIDRETVRQLLRRVAQVP